MVRDVEAIRGRVQSFALRCDLRWRTGALEELVPRGLCADASLRKAFPFQLLRLGVALVKICLSCALARSEDLGVGGFKRPAATCADPAESTRASTPPSGRKASQRTNRERGSRVRSHARRPRVLAFFPKFELVVAC